MTGRERTLSDTTCPVHEIGIELTKTMPVYARPIVLHLVDDGDFVCISPFYATSATTVNMSSWKPFASFRDVLTDLHEGWALDTDH